MVGGTEDGRCNLLRTRLIRQLDTKLRYRWVWRCSRRSCQRIAADLYIHCRSCSTANCSRRSNQDILLNSASDARMVSTLLQLASSTVQSHDISGVGLFMYPRELHDEAEGRVVHLEYDTNTSQELAIAYVTRR